MAVYTILFVLFYMFQVVPAPGNSRSCLSCNNLHTSPDQCTHYHHCQGPCFVEVHQLYGVNWYKFGCGADRECAGHIHNHDHQYGPIVCKECCEYTGCEKSLCPQYLAPTLSTVTSAPTTTATLSVLTSQAIVPSATTAIKEFMHYLIKQLPSGNTTVPCVDHDDPTFTCADMTYFGYCNPNAGAGYALAQKRCQKTCGFCT